MSENVLFTSVSLGDIALKNRIVMAPLTRSRADERGVHSQLAVEYYKQRAGAGLIISEATQISEEGRGYPRTPGIHSVAQVAAWKHVAAAVHEAGGKMVCQLWHVGRVAAKANRAEDVETVAPSKVQLGGKMYTDAHGMIEHDVPRALELDEIPRISGEYAQAAMNAIDAGFDGVELHSANGYLLHQFLSSNVNQRDDRYGGSIENRIRMPLECLDAILAKVPCSKVGIRVSPRHTFNEIEETDSDALYKAYYAELEKRNLAYLHVERPYANDTEHDIIGFANDHYENTIVACGDYDRDEARETVDAGRATAVAFGKKWVANPDLVKRFKEDAKLNEPNEDTFYQGGAKGYTDYPTLEEKEAA